MLLNPQTAKGLQHFLGFVNLYRRFIRNYSRIAAPLTRLTFTRICFLWDQEAEKVFQELRKRFTTAPILIHPDPES